MEKYKQFLYCATGPKSVQKVVVVDSIKPELVEQTEKIEAKEQAEFSDENPLLLFSRQQYEERLEYSKLDLDRYRLNEKSFQNFKAIYAKINGEQQPAVSKKLLLNYERKVAEAEAESLSTVIGLDRRLDLSPQEQSRSLELQPAGP